MLEYFVTIYLIVLVARHQRQKKIKQKSNIPSGAIEIHLISNNFDLVQSYKNIAWSPIFS